MTFRRIVLIAAALVALSGCVVAPYGRDDGGYRDHSWSHRHHDNDRYGWR